MIWYSHHLKNFPQFIVIYTVKGFGAVNKTEIFFFGGGELSYFIWSNECWQFDLCSSAFCKSSLNIWKFSVHILLKHRLENFEHYFASMRDECSYVVVWIFFGIAFLWDWNEKSPFHCWVFQICWHIEYSSLTPSSFRIWNSSAGISSPQLALFIVMLPKAHLTLPSRMSSSRWVITPSWLSKSWKSFSYSSSVFSCHSLLNIFCFC